MATISRKRKSPEPNGDNVGELDDNAARTPCGSPSKKRPKITQSQKQALIDNLQLEITERARRLRAQYALQAQDLRARIERRVNRIPMALRKANMGDLLAKYSESNKTNEAAKKSTTSKSSKGKAPASTNTGSTLSGNRNAASTTRTRGAKRTSDDMLASDKENAPFQDPENVPLSNPKKRGAANAPAGPVRVLSQFSETGVLSPKSSNSRTFPQSPLRNLPSKSQPGTVRPSSPLKHLSPVKSAVPAQAGNVENTKTRTRGPAPAGTRTTKAAAPQSKRTVTKTMTAATAKKGPPSRPGTRQQHTRNISADSTLSNVSSGTTIIKSGRGTIGSQKSTASGPTASTKRPPVPRVQAPTATSAAKKTTAAAAKKAQAEGGASTRRVLRKRV
ncbi:hypothetical protein FQN55_004373 [Onygenales sp. PD_40]|nr:hypothetical protein FQN55_004373 [Onygenales sp. PD_40]KAK2764207.1 hypothetical protein FQN53_007034 [Emmonsiellopsis sp. PD_33]KAK2796135.1 hypothetical protein FQN52_000110 [Onygenales sp. PD_12]